MVYVTKLTFNVPREDGEKGNPKDVNQAALFIWVYTLELCLSSSEELLLHFYPVIFLSFLQISLGLYKEARPASSVWFTSLSGQKSNSTQLCLTPHHTYLSSENMMKSRKTKARNMQHFLNENMSFLVKDNNSSRRTVL